MFEPTGKIRRSSLAPMGRMNQAASDARMGANCAYSMAWMQPHGDPTACVLTWITLPDRDCRFNRCRHLGWSPFKTV
jgi:hypothetical protein